MKLKEVSINVELISSITITPEQSVDFKWVEPIPAKYMFSKFLKYEDEEEGYWENMNATETQKMLKLSRYSTKELDENNYILTKSEDTAKWFKKARVKINVGNEEFKLFFDNVVEANKYVNNLIKPSRLKMIKIKHL